MQHPELVNQLKERLPEALFEKLNGSLSIDRDRLRFYLDANLIIKEQILERTQPTKGVPCRFRPGDRLLNFLRAL
jgi:hypothetical protein